MLFGIGRCSECAYGVRCRRHGSFNPQNDWGRSRLGNVREQRRLSGEYDYYRREREKRESREEERREERREKRRAERHAERHRPWRAGRAHSDLGPSIPHHEARYLDQFKINERPGPGYPHDDRPHVRFEDDMDGSRYDRADDSSSGWWRMMPGGASRWMFPWERDRYAGRRTLAGNPVGETSRGTVGFPRPSNYGGRADFDPNDMYPPPRTGGHWGSFGPEARGGPGYGRWGGYGPW